MEFELLLTADLILHQKKPSSLLSWPAPPPVPLPHPRCLPSPPRPPHSLPLRLLSPLPPPPYQDQGPPPLQPTLKSSESSSHSSVAYSSAQASYSRRKVFSSVSKRSSKVAAKLERVMLISKVQCMFAQEPHTTQPQREKKN